MTEMKLFRRTALRLIPRPGFARNVAILTLGTVLAQGIAVVAVPLTTRLYSPAEFSILAIYSSILSVLLAIAGLNLHLGIPIVESRREAVFLVLSALGVLGAGGLCLAVALIVGGDALLALLKTPEFDSLVYLLVPGYLLGGAYAILQMWFTREKAFSLVARTRVVRSFGGNGAQVGLGWLSVGSPGLLVGHLLYNGLGSLALAARFFRREWTLLKQVSFRKMRGTVGKNRRYILYTSPASLANVAAIYLPVLAIAAHPGAGEVGHLYLAQTLMMLPMALLGAAVGQAFMADARGHHRSDGLRSFFYSTLRTLIKSGVPLLVVAGVSAPFLAQPVLGSEWETTGYLMAWMTPWMVLQFLYSPCSTILYVLERQLLALVLQAAGFVIRYGGVVVALGRKPDVAMEVYAVTGAVTYAAMLMTVLLLVRRPAKSRLPD